jgi:anaerobic magnesium-protoporphyrin IX monomethyl ester cyclase
VGVPDLKVVLVEVIPDRKRCVNKDFMGGYGWAFKVGDSLRARGIELVKRVGEHLPLMSFGYLAGIFSRAGYACEYTNGVVPDADLALIYSSLVDHRAERAMAMRYKQETHATVAFIGPFASHCPDQFLDVADIVVAGEPEQFALDLVASGRLPAGVTPSPDIQNLDSLPFPDWSTFPVRSYSYFPALRQRPFLPILSSRGCPYTCEYCPYEIIKFRERSTENVLDELAQWRDRYGLRAFLFRDPIFSLRRSRVVELMEGETRMDCLDVELLELMARAGMRVVNVAVESSNNAVLKDVSRKAIPVQHQEEIVRACDRLGIRVTVFYVVGLPEDTQESIEETVAYAKRLNTHVAQFFVYTPFPGTRLYDRVKDDLITTDWEQFDCYSPVTKHPTLTPAEILDLKEWAFVSYYYRPAYLAKFAVRAVRDLLN